MRRNIFTAPKTQSRHELIIRISDGQPILFPICNSDAQYQEILKNFWELVKNGQLLGTVEDYLEN